VYIISNIPFEDQYQQVQMEQKSTWEAFHRRINEFIKYPLKMTFEEIPNDVPCPFDELP